MIQFNSGDRTAPSGVRVRFVDVRIVGVESETLSSTFYAAVSPSFDFRLHDHDTLRIEWTDDAYLTTDQVVSLLPDLIRAAYVARLISKRARRRALEGL